MKYILNSAVLTDFGIFRYEKISISDAQRWAADSSFVSTIGYEETAAALTELLGLGIVIPVNRVTIRMRPGDEALVFRLVLPTGHQRIDPKDKGQLSRVIQEGHWELGLLTMIS